MNDQEQDTFTTDDGELTPDPTPDLPLVITKLEVQAVKRIKVARFRPGNRRLIKIGGKNRQGKSSILDAIKMLLGGQREVPAEPILRGKRRADIVGHLGDNVVGDKYILHRHFTAAGGSKIEVKRVDNTPISSPQEFLNDLLGMRETRMIAFDPFKFATMEKDEQDRVCKQACGLDFTEIDGRRDAVDADRKEKAAKVKQLEGQLAGMPEHAGVPTKEDDVAELAAELERCNDSLVTKQRLADAVDACTREVNATHAVIKDTQDEITRLRLALAEEESRLARLQVELEQHDQAVIAAAEAHSAHEVLDPAPIRERLSTVQERNAKVRANAERAKVQASLDAARDSLEDVKAKRVKIDQERLEMLDNAKYPVPGMSFDETGPTLNGFPLEQASQAEKIRLGVALGATLNPGIGVFLIKDGSLMDIDAEQALEETLIQYNCQAFVECVSRDGKDPDAYSIFIEDGEIVAQAAAE